MGPHLLPGFHTLDPDFFFAPSLAPICCHLILSKSTSCYDIRHPSAPGLCRKKSRSAPACYFPGNSIRCKENKEALANLEISGILTCVCLQHLGRVSHWRISTQALPLHCGHHRFC